MIKNRKTVLRKRNIASAPLEILSHIRIFAALICRRWSIKFQVERRLYVLSVEIRSVTVELIKSFAVTIVG